MPPAIHAYVINLDRQRDKMDRLHAAFAEVPGLMIIRMSAFDAASERPPQGSVSLRSHSLIAKIRERRSHDEIATRGTVGCYMSHVRAWQRIAVQHQPCLVLEDDAIPAQGIDPVWLAEVMRAAIDGTLLPADVPWGVISLGSVPRFDVGKQSEQKVRTVFVSGKELHLVPIVAPMFLTHSYIITPATAAELAARAFPVEMHVDAYVGLRADPETAAEAQIPVVPIFTPETPLVVQNKERATTIGTDGTAAWKAFIPDDVVGALKTIAFYRRSQTAAVITGVMFVAVVLVAAVVAGLRHRQAARR